MSERRLLLLKLPRPSPDRDPPSTSVARWAVGCPMGLIGGPDWPCRGGQKVRLISIPSFASERTVVLLNLRTLEVPYTTRALTPLPSTSADGVVLTDGSVLRVPLGDTDDIPEWRHGRYVTGVIVIGVIVIGQLGIVHNTRNGV
jgi:hypothetical protein